MDLFIYILIGVIVIVFLGLIFVALKIRKNVFSHRYEDLHNYIYFDETHFDNLSKEKVEFTSKKTLIRGYILRKDNLSSYKGIIIFCHRLGPGHMQDMEFIDHLASMGYLVCCYDTLGCGSSQGQKVKGFTSSLINLNDFINYINNRDDLKIYKKMVIGHSMGGYSSNNITRFQNDLVGIVSLSSFNTTYDCLYEELNHSSGSSLKIFRYLFKIFDYFIFGKVGLYVSIDELRRSTIPHLFIAGDLDITVDYHFNHQYFEQELNSKDNYIFITSAGRRHQPLISLDAEEYDQKTIEDYFALKDNYPAGIPPKTREEYYQNLDYEKMREFDKDILAFLDAFIQDCFK